MHFKLAAAIVTALMLMLPGRAAAASCCDQAPMPCCEKAMASCCDKHDHATEVSAIDMLLSMDPQLSAAPPVRQTIEVWFKHPTWVGKSIVQGRYVIEHDNDRMARGEPCTHVYAYDNREKPVATFYCTHLDRPRASQPTVGLITTPDGMKKLTEFQFAGESAAHGYPVR
jgi:hypothetical protein